MDGRTGSSYWQVLQRQYKIVRPAGWSCPASDGGECGSESDVSLRAVRRWTGHRSRFLEKAQSRIREGCKSGRQKSTTNASPDRAIRGSRRRERRKGLWGALAFPTKGVQELFQHSRSSGDSGPSYRRAPAREGLWQMADKYRPRCPREGADRAVRWRRHYRERSFRPGGSKEGDRVLWSACVTQGARPTEGSLRFAGAAWTIVLSITLFAPSGEAS